MIKILILYGSYGGGHISAANSIKNHIFENYPEIDVEEIDAIEYINKFINKISTDAYKNATKNTPHAWKFVYEKSNSGTLAKATNRANKLMASKLKNLILEEKPDLIISTHPFSSQMCAYLKKRKTINCKLATIMTDFHIHNQWLYLPEFVDYFFVSNEMMKKEIVKNNIAPENKVFVTGIPVSDKFKIKFNKQEIFDEFWLDSEKPTVLFFGGGEFGLGRETSIAALRSLIELFENLQIIAISGKNQKMNKEFNNLVDETNSSDRVKVLEFTNKVPELMSISKFVVTKAGGLTIAESLASSLPIIIINPIPGQEEENASFLVDSKAAIWIKDNDNIKEIFKNLVSSPSKLEEMKKASMALARPDATKNICKILIDDLKKDDDDNDIKKSGVLFNRKE